MTTELLGVHALIVFIMVMMTFYAYVVIIHTTVTSHEHCTKFSCFFFFTYESQLSVPPVEQKRNHLETDTLPLSRWEPYKNLSPREQKNIASFCSSFRISSIFKACK